MKYVVDASVVASLVLPDEASEQAESFARKLADDVEVAAPGVLQLEILNVLLMAERRKRITGAQLTDIIGAMDVLPISLQPPLTIEQRAEVLRLAQKHQLTSYDAAYLELTIRLAAGLASFDDLLLKAAKAEGASLAL